MDFTFVFSLALNLFMRWQLRDVSEIEYSEESRWETGEHPEKPDFIFVLNLKKNLNIYFYLFGCARSYLQHGNS